MDFNKINFEVIEEALLGSDSKEYITSVFTSAAINSLDTEIMTMNADNMPANLKAIPKTLNISNEKALTVITITQ
jgi:hypothetical protein